MLCTDFVEVSRVLTFDAERTTEFVGIGIINDFEREVVTETIDLQLSFVEEERGGGLLLLPNQTTVNILDNDGEYEKHSSIFARIYTFVCTKQPTSTIDQHSCCCINQASVPCIPLDGFR